MSTTAKRNMMSNSNNNGNSRSSFNMKDNWNDYGGSTGVSPNRQNNKGKFQQQKSSNGRNSMAKGASFSDAETSSSNGMLSQFNVNSSASKCTESMMATVPSPGDDSSLMINQDPAIAAIAPSSTADKQASEASSANSTASVVPQVHCDTVYQQQQQYPMSTTHQVAYQAENGQLVYGSTPIKNGGGCYEMSYDGYSTPNHNQQIMHHQQQQQQQYMWQSTSAANDYASVAAANAAAAVINNTSAQQQCNGGMNTPVNMTSPPAAYYTPAPSYQSYGVYDPTAAMATVSYPGGNMVTTTAFSPMSNAAQATLMSSPQQQHTSSAALFHTYQTPPSLAKYPHQLYMTPPASGSPADLLLNSNSASVVTGDRHLAGCESSSQQSLGQQQQQQQLAGIYTTASPYMYTPSYLASPPPPNTAYQYQTPIMYSPIQAPPSAQMGQQQQFVHHHHHHQQQQQQSAMLQTPTTAAFQNLTINTNTPCDNNKYHNKFNSSNSNNNIKASHYSYKKNAMNKSQQFNTNSAYSPMMSGGETPGHMFSPMSGVQTPNQQLCFDESLTCAHDHEQLQHHNAHNSIFPPSSYMSPMPSSSAAMQQPSFQQTPTPSATTGYHDFASAIAAYNTSLTPPVPAIYGAGTGFDCSQYDSYGDEFVDDNEPGAANESSNGDGDDEQLACQICRGRRMCFCYFLKVRYYKFPSFFDLVDHQYKKWRTANANAKAAAMTTTTPRKA